MEERTEIYHFDLASLKTDDQYFSKLSLSLDRRKDILWRKN